MRVQGQHRGRRTKGTLIAQLVTLLGGTFLWTASAAAEEDRPKAYIEGAGSLNVGLYGLAKGVHPAVHVGAGIRFPWFSGGLAATYATIEPDPSHYGYSIFCSRFLDYPCSDPVLRGTYVSVDAGVQFHPLSLLGFEPYIEGLFGWNTISLSDPSFKLLGQANFSMQGLHVGAGLGTQYHFTDFLAALASIGYGWSLVEQPNDILKGGGVLADLNFISNHAHQFQISLGLQLQL